MNQAPSQEHIARKLCAEHNYEFIQFVGEGAYKQVYQVTCPNGVNAALKILSGQIEILRVDREIDAMRRFDHANISKLYFADFFEVEGERVFVTLEEFVDGGSMQEAIDQNDTAPKQHVHSIGSQLISCLDDMNRSQLVHRDINLWC